MSLNGGSWIDHPSMVIDMNDAKLVTLEQLRGFLAGAADLGLTPTTADPVGRYGFIKKVLKRFKYPLQSKPNRGLIRRYLQRLTGYSRPQLTRLIAQYLRTGRLVHRYRATTTSYVRKFTPEDIVLLAELDSLHGTLSGPATRVLLGRAVRLFGEVRYARLATISVAHLYNLRAQPLYQQRRVHYSKTQSRPSSIGARRAPAPEGRPGFIRIDTVHQGDHDGRKGLYHINAVDIITQWQLVATCERISEAYLLPVIGELLAGFPFVILGFHSDGGSEYINSDVAKLLDKLRVEFTRSRPRHTNDNALVESKNGSVIRKQFGYAHIAQPFAADMNAFCRDFLNPYVNFHRPCYFAVDAVDAKGKIRKQYPHNLIMTPFDKLKTLPPGIFNLCPGVTLASLERQAQQMTDNQAAKSLTDARSKLFRSIHRRSKAAA
jgi:transposase InsO family protein